MLQICECMWLNARQSLYTSLKNQCPRMKSLIKFELALHLLIKLIRNLAAMKWRRRLALFSPTSLVKCWIHQHQMEVERVWILVIDGNLILMQTVQRHIRTETMNFESRIALSLDSQWQLKFWFYQFWSFSILVRLNSLTRLRFSSKLNTRFPFQAQFLSIKTIVEAWILAPWLVGPFGCTFHVKNRKLISSFWRPDIVPVVSDSTNLKMAWHSMDIRFFIRFFSSRRFLFCIGWNCMHLPRVYRLVCHHNNHYRLKMCKPQKWLLFIRQSSPQHTQFSTFTVCATFSLSLPTMSDVNASTSYQL